MIKYNKFLLYSAGSFVSFCILYFIFVAYICVPAPEKIPSSFKQLLIENITTRKVIIDSGSNSLHGIDPELLEDYFKLPIINLGDHAGYPLQYKLYRIAPYLTQGDIVILPLEYVHYSREKLSSIFTEHVLTNYLSHYFHQLPIHKKIDFVLMQLSFTSLKNGLLKQSYDKAKYNTDEVINQYNSFLWSTKNKNSGSYGSYLLDSCEDAMKVPLRMNCDQYIFHMNIKKDFKISKEFRNTLKLMQRLEKKGVTFYFTWPTVVDTNKSKCYAWLDHELTSKFYKEIKATVNSHGFKFIGKVEESHFSKEYFLNTYYHVTKEGARLRTLKLIENLKENNIESDSTASNFDIYLKKIDDIVTAEVTRLTLEREIEIWDGKQLAPAQFDRYVHFICWHDTEEWGKWTKGQESILRFKIRENKNKPLTLKINGVYFNGAEKTEVLVNGQKLGDYFLESASLEIPPSMLQESETVEVTLKHRNAVSPYSLDNNSPDKRVIKYAMHNLSFNYP